MATEPKEEPTPLGARVEHTLIELIEAGVRHGPIDKLSIADCAPCQEALAVARSRIRERMAEPGPEPSFEGTPFPPHMCWCKDSHSNHRDCKRRGFHRCGCGATYKEDGSTHRWVGGLAPSPSRLEDLVEHVQDFAAHNRFELVEDAEPALPLRHLERAADIAGAAEPKPQHIFERRTSKHSAFPLNRLPLEPFLQRFPEIARLGTPYAPGEEPKMTIITALQFKELAETVDRLVADFNARL